MALNDSQAWRADTAGEPATWRHPLTSDLAFDAIRIRRELVHGRGFVVVDTARFQPASKEEITQLFCMLGSRIGTPVEQNTAGTLLYHVTNTGGDVQYGARFSSLAASVRS